MKLLFILPFACFLLGCTHDSIKPYLPDGPTNIELRAQHSVVTGFAGEVKQDSLVAIARDAQGVAVQGVSINYAIEHPAAWKGKIFKFAQDTVSDANGMVHALYEVTLSQSGQVVIEAMFSIGNIVPRDTISLTLLQGGMRAEH